MNGFLGRVPLALLLAGCVVLAGCDQFGSEAAQTPPAPPPAEVAVVTLQPQPVTISTTLPGRTSPYQIAEVRPQVSGILQERLFQEGADVQQGQPLYKIDPAVYQAAYASAEADLARAEASLVSARNKARRYKELVRTNAVSRASQEDADAALGEAEAAVAAAKAEVDTAKINLDYTTVRAPIAGRVGRSAVTPGALLTANQATALTTIHQLDPIYVDVTQSSAELLKLRRALADGRYQRVDPKRAEVALSLEDDTPYALKGSLEFADVTVNESTGAVTLRALFPNPEAVLLPGMFVRAEVQAGVDPEAILVPQPGVTRDPKGNPVALVVGKDDKVEQRMLVTDRTVGDSWLVTDGLQAGDRVIVEGVQKARPGAVVQVIDAGSKSVADAADSVPAGN